MNWLVIYDRIISYTQNILFIAIMSLMAFAILNGLK